MSNDKMLLAAEHDGMRFEMEPDLPEVGTYLYVYNSNGNCVYDYLQNDEAAAKAQALEEFGVPLASWQLQKSIWQQHEGEWRLRQPDADSK